MLEALRFHRMDRHLQEAPVRGKFIFGMSTPVRICTRSLEIHGILLEALRFHLMERNSQVPIAILRTPSACGIYGRV